MDKTRVCLHHDRFLRIELCSADQWFYLDWTGYQSDKSVKEGINLMIQLLQEHGIAKVLNDNTNTLGIWVNVAYWLVKDALPRARKAGMTAFAQVHGPSRLSRVSAETALALLRPTTVEIKAFDDLIEAKRWLRNYP